MCVHDLAKYESRILERGKYQSLNVNEGSYRVLWSTSDQNVANIPVRRRFTRTRRIRFVDDGPDLNV